MIIDGTTYAAGKDMVGLCRQVPKEKAYFLNEAVPIYEKFKLKKYLTTKKKQEAVIKELQRLKNR